MKRLLPTVLGLMLFGCGGSDAGSVFDETTDGGTASGDTGSAGSESGTNDDSAAPPVDSGDPPPPVDSGDPPPPVDSGVKDSGSTLPDVSVPDTPTPITCTEPGGKMYMGHCYFPLMGRSYFAARDFCASLKAHLVTITSDGEQKHVESVGFNERWIGLVRAEGSPPAASSFKWITGEAVGFTNWDFGEPNGSGFCARLRSDGRWADTTCSQTLPAVCERE